MTKERLRGYVKLKKEKNNIQQQLEGIETELYSPKNQKITGAPHGRAINNDRLERLLEDRQELLDLYREKLGELYSEMRAIEKAIEVLDPLTRSLIRYKYFDGLTWEEVCVRLNYSWRQVHRIHGKALEKLREQ